MSRQSELLQEILNLGNVFALNIRISPQQVENELTEFAMNWQPYNAHKGDWRRFGLSVTSLDGGLSGTPDLNSLRDHNVMFGTSLDELSFRMPTAVYEKCLEIRSVLEPFANSLGRCHFLKFGMGGFFPFHRDGVMGKNNVFRIFVPLYCHSPRDFVFLLERKCLELESGRAYFINTLLEHALFSFHPNSVHLVMNVEVNEASVATLKAHLESF